MKAGRLLTHGIVLVLLMLAIFLFINTGTSQDTEREEGQSSVKNESMDKMRSEKRFSRFNLQTNTSKSLIDLDLVLNGGPGKDGIPAIDNPQFTAIEDTSSTITNETLGIVYEGKNTVRFYPFNILVWHEIVNDTVDGEHIAITFCPLCGSAIGYSREISGTTVQFGVSGLLYESNLLMYDKATESLWSQIEGRAVVGEYAETVLELIDIEQMTYQQVRDTYPEAQILSVETGFDRDYTLYPYGDYEENNDSFIFPVTYKGEGLPAKDIVYATSIDNTPVAFVFASLKESPVVSQAIGSIDVTATLLENGEVVVEDATGKQYPGYFTMWFSWANHNLPEGVNPEANGIVWGIE